jgi:uncharacterized protein YceK
MREASELRVAVCSVGMVLATLLPLGCRRSSAPRQTPALPAAESFDAPALSPEPARSPPLRFAQAEEGFGVALPTGCRYREPTVRALLERRAVSFFSLSEDGSTELLLVEPTKEGASALVQSTAPERPLGAPAPLFDLGAPFLAHDGARFRGLFTSGPPDRRALLLTRASAPTDAAPARELLAVGDGAGVFDFRCQHRTCAVLSTRLGQVAARGLSLFVGPGDAPAARYRRIDLERLAPTSADKDNSLDDTANEQATGVAIASVTDEDHVAVVTGTPTAVSVHALVRTDDGGVADTLHGPLDAPFGALDTTLLPAASVDATAPTSFGLSVTHGARVEGLCAVPRPLGRLVREGLPAIDLPLSAPFHTALLRPLVGRASTNEAIGAAAARNPPAAALVYSSALRCHDDRRRFVTVQLLDETGAPHGPSMVVGEARGFAVRSEGRDLDLVLLRAEDIVVAKLTCDGE